MIAGPLDHKTLASGVLQLHPPTVTKRIKFTIGTEIPSYWSNLLSLVNLFKRSNPNVKIAHHLHASFQLIKATQLNIPSILLIRDPKDALASLISWDETLKVGTAIRCYSNFYETILPIKDKFCIAKFEILIEDPDSIISALNSKFNCDFNLPNYTQEGINRIMDEASQFYKNPLYSS